MLKQLIVALTFCLPLAAAAAELTDAIDTPYAAPELTGIDTWINSPPLTLKELRGKVVLLDFWAYSCVNCVRTLPYLAQWDKKYRDKGLVIMGIHAPEFDFEKSPANVERAVKKWHVAYPVGLDNQLATWGAFNNRYWPAHYLINKDGKVVYTHSGEGHYDITESNIRALLGMNVYTDTGMADPATGVENQTPETYLGYARAERFKGSLFAPDTAQSYLPASTLPVHHWTLSGKWKAGKEHITSAQAGAGIKLRFFSRNVYLVLGSQTGQKLEVALTLDGIPIAPVTVENHSLYKLVEQKDAGIHMLDIKAKNPGLEAYAFTFGN